MEEIDNLSVPMRDGDNLSVPSGGGNHEKHEKHERGVDNLSVPNGNVATYWGDSGLVKAYETDSLY